MNTSEQTKTVKIVDEFNSSFTTKLKLAISSAPNSKSTKLLYVPGGGIRKKEKRAVTKAQAVFVNRHQVPGGMSYNTRT